ncbi:protein of unknown function [Methylocaldum szegediense]|uniref:Uncharacterized protein n=1 Tax=Methylocaldum szegediense TaxID=73780 RepID=A0ABM9I7F0_9GAMM|nr:protein of unknown function [Methylocaldum szegediense]
MAAQPIAHIVEVYREVLSAVLARRA